ASLAVQNLADQLAQALDLQIAQLFARHRLRGGIPELLRRVSSLGTQDAWVVRRHRLRTLPDTAVRYRRKEGEIATETTVGIDIGATSVKAIAADGDGNVVASTRVPHEIRVPDAESLEHDIDAAWRDGVRRAYADVSRDVDVLAVNVAAMVPSLGALTAA